MRKAVASVALIASLALAPSVMAADQKAPAPPRPMGWFAQTIRSVVVFHSCTERLKAKFNLGPLDGLNVTDMDTHAADASGPMDVKFEATTVEKKTGRRSHFVGVCHVGREGETSVEAHLVGQQTGVVRRVAPGKVTG